MGEETHSNMLFFPQFMFNLSKDKTTVKYKIECPLLFLPTLSYGFGHRFSSTL